METKYVKVPFNVELAKKITEKSVDGRIVTHDGRNARVICWDKKSDSIYNIVALLDEKIMERILTYTIDGSEVDGKDSDNDLILEAPEYMTFKDGDVIAYDGFDTISITMADLIRNVNYVFAHYYAELRNGKLHFHEEGVSDVLNVGSRLATESEKKMLIDALKASKEPKAKEYLKRIFNIEVKPECEFKQKDWVLIRDYYEDMWCLDIYSHKVWDKDEECYHYYCVGCWSYQCIPYNEKTAHLLGTTEDYKGD